MSNNEVSRAPANFPQGRENPQYIIKGKLSKNANDQELIKFSIYLGFFQLSCIVHIPFEGDDTSVVFVKFGVKRNDADRREAFGSQME